jgi:hypothetical protein
MRRKRTPIPRRAVTAAATTWIALPASAAAPSATLGKVSDVHQPPLERQCPGRRGGVVRGSSAPAATRRTAQLPRAYDRERHELHRPRRPDGGLVVTKPSTAGVWGCAGALAAPNDLVAGPIARTLCAALQRGTL